MSSIIVVQVLKTVLVPNQRFYNKMNMKKQKSVSDKRICPASCLSVSLGLPILMWTCSKLLLVGFYFFHLKYNSTDACM